MDTEAPDYEILVSLKDRSKPLELELPMTGATIGVGGTRKHAVVGWDFKGVPDDLELAVDFLGPAKSVLLGKMALDAVARTMQCTIGLPEPMPGDPERSDGWFRVAVKTADPLAPSTVTSTDIHLVIDRSVDPPGGHPVPHPHPHRRPCGGERGPAPYRPTRRKSSGSPASER